MAKRAKNEGTIFKRSSDGRWVGRVAVGIDAVTGKRQVQTVYGWTEAEALSKRDALQMEKGKSLDFKRQKDTLSAFLSWWLETEVKPEKAAKTYQEYELAVRKYIVPFIGATKMKRLDAMSVSEWLAKMATKKFTNHMRRRGLTILRVALNRAVKLKIIDSNPAVVVDLPKVTKRKVEPLDLSQCSDLFKVAKEHRLGDAVIVSAMTGLRKGEILALEWPAVNLLEGVLVVRRSLEEVAGQFGTKAPKSEAGRRVVPLAGMACEALKRRRDKAIKEGMDPECIPLVFPTTTGTLHRSSNFDRRVWHPIREAAELPATFKFHDLRHQQAPLLLAAGADMKVVQERLGHSDYTLTANTYAHLLAGVQAEAAEKVDRLFQSSSEASR